MNSLPQNLYLLCSVAKINRQIPQEEDNPFESVPELMEYSELSFSTHHVVVVECDAYSCLSTGHVGKSGNEWAMGINGPLTINEKVLA